MQSEGESTNKAALVEEIEELLRDLTWSYTRSDGRLVELIPNGADTPVVLADLERYIRVYVEARLREGTEAIAAFREGVISVLPENALALLCWDELEHIVCGSPGIDIQRLREHTEYDDDISEEDDHIVAFWEVLHELSEAEKSTFLRFVWARPTLPPKGVEFPQKFKIQSAAGEDTSLSADQYLPKAHTCFFSINLPKYSSKALLAERLRYAMANCSEMDADYKLTDTDVAGWGAGSPASR
jgi:hypothetical protein